MSPLPRFGLQKTTAPLSRYLARQAAALADRWRGRNVYKTAVENMWQGIALYDRTGHLLLHNAQFCTMLGLSRREVTAARTHRDVVRLSVAAGNHGEVDADRVWRDDVAFIARSQPSLTYLDLPNLRIIAESHQPLKEGGWVRTYADVSGRRQFESRIIHLARHDVLTNLPNRMFFRERLEHALAHASDHTSFALMFLDLDRFKAVNDTLGHAIGDMLLQQVAGRLRETVRPVDTVARLGGDEFAVIQVELESEAQSNDLALALIDAIACPFQIEGHRICIGTSVGITIARADGSEADQLLRNADLALYQAKSVGRSRLRFYSPADPPQQRSRAPQHDGEIEAIDQLRPSNAVSSGS